MTARHTVRSAARSERGAISALVILLIVMLFAVAGLIYDGGRAINARQQTYDDVEQAARAGANQIDEDLFRRSGVVQIMPGAAADAARSYLLGLNQNRAAPYDPARIAITATATEVTVRAERTVPTGLLQLVFVNSFDVAGEATSQPEIGIGAGL
ncbi:TadE/TadG family type IV pilus assembly protein [Phytoactinopolyspora limicola]|uniref:TadE/TadG family type IV pilus assembly protein n=1 Tax=Phytoactinopolyspora limicola TaxID=2715536 RepID=UPI00140733D6|nr:pilus assembly protein TadG-related protein [Phytoactinopolyspora limicola]